MSIVEIKFYDMLSKLLNPESDKAMQIGWALLSQNPSMKTMNMTMNMSSTTS